MGVDIGEEDGRLGGILGEDSKTNIGSDDGVGTRKVGPVMKVFVEPSLKESNRRLGDCTTGGSDINDRDAVIDDPKVFGTIGNYLRFSDIEEAVAASSGIVSDVVFITSGVEVVEVGGPLDGGVVESSEERELDLDAILGVHAHGAILQLPVWSAIALDPLVSDSPVDLSPVLAVGHREVGATHHVGTHSVTSVDP
jgi:hypothetical protein